MARHRREKRQRTKELYVIGWQVDVLMCVGGTKHQARNAYLKRWGMEPDAEAGAFDHVSDGAFFSHPDGKACCIWIPGAPRTPYEYGNVAHEAVHAACHILSRSGVEYMTSTDAGGLWVNDEPWTYLVAAIVEQLLTFAKER